MAAKNQRRHQKKFGWTVRLIFLAVSIVLSLLVLEVAVRISGMNDEFTRRIFSKNLLKISDVPGLIYEQKPGGDSDIDGVENRISSQGLRDREYAIPKPADTFRIIALGDSVTYGLGVRAEDAFPKILENLIEKENQSGTRVEVLNYGVNGYKTVQEVILLQEKGMQFEPDLVILEYNLNDPGDFSRELSYFKYWQNRAWTSGDMSLTQKTWARLTQFSDLAFMIQYRTLKLRLSKVAEGTDSDARGDRKRNYDGYFHLYQSPPVMAALESALDTLENLGETHQFRVVLAVFPILMEFDNYRWMELHEQVLKMGRERNFVTVDILDYYRNAGKTGPELRRREDDFEHPNPPGHRIAAEALLDIIHQNQLLPLAKQKRNK